MARMRVGRLLRSTEGVGAESRRVAKVAQGGRFEESREVAESQRIAQASRHRAGRRVAQAGVAQSRRGVGRRGAWRGAGPCRVRVG